MSSRIRGLGCAGLLLVAACTGRAGDASTNNVGTLGLQLRTEVNHVAYRLRDGVFEVTGPQLLTLNTEDDVDAASLEGTLAVGTYDIELLPGWRLERESASGFETLVAQLSSPNPLPFEIEPGQRTNLHYDFFTDGTRIGLGDGGFEVSIGVTDTSQTPGEGPACPGGRLPAPRDCSSPLDNDCDGVPDNTLDATCTCAIGAVQLCGTHPAFDGLGICRAGQQICLGGPDNATSAFGACVGSVGPLEQDSCSILGDDSNCDGIPNGGCPVSTPPSPPSFERDLWPIFQRQCAPCHTTLGRGGHFVGSADLATAFADATRLGATLIERLDGGGMPPACQGLPGDPGCISVENLQLIQLWINSGMAP